MANVATTLLHASLGFAERRLQSLVGATLVDPASLARTLRDGAPSLDLAGRLDACATELANGANPALAAAVAADLAEIAQARTRMASHLASASFSTSLAQAAASELATAAALLDAAVEKLSRHVAKLDDPDPAKRMPDVHATVGAIRSPWTAAFASIPPGEGAAFDAFAKQVLGVGGGVAGLPSKLVRDAAKRTLAFPFAGSGSREPVSGFKALALDAPSVEPYLEYGAAPAFGVRMTTSLEVGMRGEGLVDRIVPSAAPRAASRPVTIQVDSRDGLSLGDGRSPRVMLPMQFDFAGVELRDAGLSVAPDGALDLTMSLAGPLGPMRIAVDGFGVRIDLSGLAGGGAAPLALAVRPPDGAGVRVDAGIVRGGGLLERKGDAYGGALELTLGTFRVTAIGYVDTDPFSLVLVIGVQFRPAFELGLGFTLNGLGGLLALERRIASDAMREAIVQGAADALLFPDDPVAAAPAILAKLPQLFPEAKGGFVVGPIAELGWGSQARFVRAKLGIALSLPDPKIVLLGALRIAVPSVDTPRELAIVDLNAGIYGEITPERFLIVVGLTDSRVAGFAISGDIGLLIAWGANAEIAISVGGFHPRFSPPAALAGLRRITIGMAPAPRVSLHASGYVAITSNTLQFGAAVRLVADLEVVSGEAWIALDALFRWAPQLGFEIDIAAGITLRAFGESFASVEFRGRLAGMSPWTIEGNASVEVWFLPRIAFDLGPFTWGGSSAPPLPKVSPLDLVADALAADDAWRPRLPVGVDALVRFVEGDGPALFAHPLGAIEARQSKVPLETPIDRIGRNPVTAHRVNLAEPKLGGKDAGAASDVEGLFAPGEFLSLADDELMSRAAFERFPAGATLAGTGAPTAGARVEQVQQWHTVFPHALAMTGRDDKAVYVGLHAQVFRTGAVAKASRMRGNAYLTSSDAVALAPAGTMEVRSARDLAGVAGAPGRATTTIAAYERDRLSRAGGGELELLVAGTAS